MRTTAFLLGTLTFTLSVAAGCDDGNPNPAPGGGECSDADTPGCVVTSGKQRIQNPDVPAEDLDALVAGNTTFAFDLYQQLKAEEGNLFYSPFSISAALAMTWAGAKGQTETDMAAAMEFKLSQDKLHPAFNSLDLALASRGQNAKASDGKGFRLRVANALWGQTGMTFETPFLDTLGLHYGAGVRVVDFEGATTQAVDLINGWVDTQTEGKIPKLVSEDNITADTRFVITNAVYFNAAWAEPFKVEDTADGEFSLGGGAKVTVPMMHAYRDTGYVAGDGFQAVSMVYDGGELSMILLLPDAGTLGDFESSLDAALVSDIVGSLSEYSVELTMPKFEIEGDFGLAKPLSDMGMGVAFTPSADFTGISKDEQLQLMDVVHKSFVKVNEAGTEAAAATAVIGGTTSAPPPATMTLDRPFLFFIRDNPTGSVLFVGRVADPSQ